MTGNAFPVDASSGAPSYASLAWRTARSAMLMQAGGLAFSAQGGMRPGAQPSVSITDPTVTIQPFACVVDPGSGQGPYICSFTSNEVVTLNAHPGAGTSRIDGLDVQVPPDPPTGTRLANVVYTAGTAAASPSAPAIPARSIRIGTVTVPNVGTPTYAPTTTFGAAAGGILGVPSSGSYPGTPHNSMAIYDMALDQILVYDGTGWDPYISAAAHAVARNTTLTLADTTYTGAVSWNVGDIYNIGDIAFASGLFTVGTTGLYRAETNATYPATNVGVHIRAIRFLVNGSEATYLQGKSWWIYPSASIPAIELTATGALQLTAGDTVQASYYQTTGGSININPRTFSLTRVG